MFKDNWQGGESGHPALHNDIARVLNFERYAHRYASLQAAIDDTPDYGTLVIPPGVTTFDRVDIGAKTITLQGYGAFLLSAATPGGAAWNNPANLKGSILKSTATEGVAIDATAGRIHLRGLGIVGAGAGIGVKTGVVSNPYRGIMRWSDVWLANFETGAQINDCYNNRLDTVVARGCNTGLHLKGANVTTLTACDVTTAETGVYLQGSANVLVQGGAIQGCTDTGLLIEASEECTAQNIYFENKNAQYAIRTAGISDRLALLNNHTSTPADRVLIGPTTNHCYILHGKYGNLTSQDPSNLILRGSYNVVYVSYNHAVIEDTGMDNQINRLGP